MTTLIPENGGSSQHGAVTLTSSAGPLTFRVVEKRTGPLKLTVQNGTGTYAGDSGTGTVNVQITDPGYRHLFTDTNKFRLTLKS
jgi:hypothetical protein